MPTVTRHAIEFLSPHNPTHTNRYLDIMGRARNFFSVHAQRRYSPTTLSRLHYCAEYMINPGHFDEPPSLPLITAHEVPVTIDLDTEAKSGGLGGMLLCWPGDRTLVAVHTEQRRSGIGRAMFHEMQRNVGMVSMILWVGQNNIVGHQFALAAGLIPAAMNSTGALRYDSGTPDV